MDRAPADQVRGLGLGRLGAGGRRFLPGGPWALSVGLDGCSPRVPAGADSPRMRAWRRPTPALFQMLPRGSGAFPALVTRLRQGWGCVFAPPPRLVERA